MGDTSYHTANTNENDIKMANHPQDMIPEIPVTIDRHRPPVRNDDNAYRCACRCGCQCNCGCTCARAAIEDNVAEAVTSQSLIIQQTHYRSSENGDGYVHSPEGAEDHLIEVGDFGHIPEKEILRALSRHGRLPYTHHGILPSEYSPFTTPTATSMIVEASDDCDETASSVYSHMSTRSGGSSLLGYTGHWLDQIGMTTFTSGLGTVYSPLALTPEYPVHIEISERDLRDLPSFDLGFL
ncbi:hypothetical protein HII31_01484 [Pseudocercospora fuligena]|uniref:Uncharacterized protein n=1 Tax=Pseudocercospora fuligena TaxID=685502 RepID=A0A8H6RTR3_9PEZI|nr:hypothetical protein HII31_01484 [Pseudocercospora fuligena]